MCKLAVSTFCGAVCSFWRGETVGFFGCDVVVWWQDVGVWNILLRGLNLLKAEELELVIFFLYWVTGKRETLGNLTYYRNFIIAWYSCIYLIVDEWWIT